MRLCSDASARLPASAVLLLAFALVLLSGWAVIGKHRLDPEARQIYKASRGIVPEQAASLFDVAPVVFAAATVTPPPVPRWASAPHREPLELPAHRGLPRSSRSPPAA